MTIYKTQGTLPVRYRPRTLTDIVGNGTTKKTLYGFFAKKALPPAMGFFGDPGSGKTTLARIISYMMLCQNPNSIGDPCGVCPSCYNQLDGRSQPFQIETHNDIVEVNGTHKGGKDDILDVIKYMNHVPMYGFRIHIIDEAQGLTKQAISVFLPFLENPPPNVVFIFCSSDYHSIQEAIRQRLDVSSFNLNYPTEASVARKLQEIASVEYNDYIQTYLHNYYREIARASGCKMRVALSMMDKLASLIIGVYTTSNSNVVVDIDSDIKASIESVIKTSKGNYDAIVIEFLDFSFKGLIRRPQEIIKEIEDTKNFLTILISYCEYAVQWLAKEETSSKEPIKPAFKRGVAYVNFDKNLRVLCSTYGVTHKNALIMLRAAINVKRQMRSGMYGMTGNELMISLLSEYSLKCESLK
jgi:DNA polymerase III gamma/tau subunit